MVFKNHQWTFTPFKTQPWHISQLMGFTTMWIWSSGETSPRPQLSIFVFLILTLNSLTAEIVPEYNRCLLNICWVTKWVNLLIRSGWQYELLKNLLENNLQISIFMKIFIILDLKIIFLRTCSKANHSTRKWCLQSITYNNETSEWI